eukprot:2909441-Amphidinium_carterae.2
MTRSEAGSQHSHPPRQLGAPIVFMLFKRVSSSPLVSKTSVAVPEPRSAISTPVLVDNIALLFITPFSKSSMTCFWVSERLAMRSPAVASQQVLPKPRANPSPTKGIESMQLSKIDLPESSLAKFITAGAVEASNTRRSLLHHH